MNCLIARHDKENPASGWAMQKIGMRFSHEDPHTKLDKKVHKKVPNRVITMMHYTLTKEDYFKKIDSIVN